MVLVLSTFRQCVWHELVLQHCGKQENVVKDGFVFGLVEDAADRIIGALATIGKEGRKSEWGEGVIYYSSKHMSRCFGRVLIRVRVDDQGRR